MDTDESKKNMNCRVCLRDAQDEIHKCLSIFETYNGRTIAEKVNSIANVNITEGDGLPDTICPACLLQLENAISFKVKCEASNKILLCNVLLSPQSSAKKLQIIKISKSNIKQEPSEIEDSPDLDDFCNDRSDTEEKFEDLETKTETDVKSIPDSFQSFDDGCNEDKTLIEIELRKSRAIDLQLICDDCGGHFKSKCKLRVHWKKVHQPNDLMCQLCKRMFKSYRAFNVHKKKTSRSCLAASNTRIQGVGRNRIFFCTNCDYKSKHIKDMAAHLTTHSGERRFHCKDCSKCFTQHSSLQSHREQIHKDYITETTCHLCGKHIQGRTKLYRHMITHRERDIPCKICNKKFKHIKYVRAHMLRHTRVKSYTCEICAASFYTPTELYNHISKVHNKSKTFKCDLCDYMMYSKSSLKIHISKHTGSNVVCHYCGKFCENMEQLGIHQKRHLERNVPCTQCDKKYHNKRSLSKHMSKHHRCTMLVDRREDIKLSYTNNKVKRESVSVKDDSTVILSPSGTSSNGNKH